MSGATGVCPQAQQRRELSDRELGVIARKPVRDQRSKAGVRAAIVQRAAAGSGRVEDGASVDAVGQETRRAPGGKVSSGAWARSASSWAPELLPPTTMPQQAGCSPVVRLGMKIRVTSAGATTAPTICIPTNPATGPGSMPTKLSVKARPIVTAWLAKDTDEANHCTAHT